MELRANLMATPISTICLLRFLLYASLLSLKSGFAIEGRESAESHHVQPIHHNVHITSLMPSSACSPSPKGHDQRASLEVVHKHGPCSKLRPHKANSPSHTQILAQDESRVASIQSRLAKNLAGGSNLKASKATLPSKSASTLGSGNYVVTVGLGSPKRDLTFIFDTGSDLTWTQCEPCVGYCYQQREHIFDPSTSLSYSNVSCDSPSCEKLESATGNSPGCSSSTCLYGIRYGDGSYSIGFFAREKLSLTSTDVFNNFQFGCGQNNRGLFGGTAGLLGLARNPLSLVSQTAQKYGKVFSYCLPSSSSSTGYLSFGSGDGDSKAVKFTPSEVNSDYPSFYFLDMVGISVGERKLPIPKSVFSTAGTIIDSGTVISRLPPTVYSSVQKVFRELMSDYPRVKGVSILDTCYDLSKYKTVKVPKIILYFSGGAEMDLAPEGIIYVLKVSQVCLAFAGNSDDDEVAIIGNVQQKTIHVVYDDAEGRVGFAPSGCN
ncbi:hypothetical protein VitviT2T_004944 [Vitis vinifera]|uniref:Peptidase A1 domain-containing protein n=2 Tax=Vitis vinifera TaxID=29760 RepID=A0ABY9BRQ5_VITVI|nr:aspartyl protease family protein At5g10770 [Vitis vinifera]WJZ85405.1 hypothetical protein VitviT2T_004944 [Vitis vinifera]|eukprot:XP_002283470.1 PREDICTED: aspartyl protease family protein At5g10770-like [Vitis vinifera]